MAERAIPPGRRQGRRGRSGDRGPRRRRGGRGTRNVAQSPGGWRVGCVEGVARPGSSGPAATNTIGPERPRGPPPRGGLVALLRTKSAHRHDQEAHSRARRAPYGARADASRCRRRLGQRTRSIPLPRRPDLPAGTRRPLQGVESAGFWTARPESGEAARSLP